MKEVVEHLWLVSDEAFSLLKILLLLLSGLILIALSLLVLTGSREDALLLKDTLNPHNWILNLDYFLDAAFIILIYFLGFFSGYRKGVKKNGENT